MKIRKMKNKAANLNEIIKGVIDETIDIPNNSIIFLNPANVTKVFTKKRLELLALIDRSNPKSVNELASLAKRTKQAVDRDLKYMEGLNLVELNKNGRIKTPKLKREVIVFPLRQIKKAAAVCA